MYYNYTSFSEKIILVNQKLEEKEADIVKLQNKVDELCIN